MKKRKFDPFLQDIEQLVADTTDWEEIDMPAHLKSLREQVGARYVQIEREKQKAVANDKFRQTAEIRVKNLTELDDAIAELELEQQESIWEQVKNKQEPRKLMQKMIKEMETVPENQRRFMENLLLPDKLQDDYLAQ